MFWSSTGILLNDKTRIEVKSQSVFCNGAAPRILQISPATAINNPDFRKIIAIRTSFLQNISQNSKISVWFTSASNCCDSSLNLWISCFWLMSFGSCSLCRCFRTSQSALWHQCVAVHPAVSPLRSIYRYSGVSSVALGLPVALRILLRFPRWSCFLYK